MNDTTHGIRKKQLELHLQLKEEERWLRGFEMIENGRTSLIAAIKNKHPQFTNQDILIEMVRILYKRDLPESFLNGFEKRVRKK